MSSENERLTRRWFEEVWNKGRAEAIDEMLSPDVIAHGLTDDGSDLHGQEAFKSFHTMFIGAFPDIRITIEDMMSAEDRTAVRFSGTATHKGDHLGVAPTHLKVRFTGMSFTLWKEGKIVEGWNNVDILGILRQIGAL